MYRIFDGRKINRKGTGRHFASEGVMRHTGVFLLAVIVLTSVGAADAATTSRLEGRVIDDQDGPLAGVQITISSESLIGGPQSTITSDDGGFSFHFLLVGRYTVEATLTGYVPATAVAQVQLDRTASVTVRMVPVTFASEIEVGAIVPIIDVTRTNTGEVFDEKYLRLTAIGSGSRNYLQIMNQAAGVGTGRIQKVFGAENSENVYLVDGFNTTDVASGASATRFAFDAVEEASALTGGMNAEFGHATGGVLNVVTKSGGNSFSGTFDARYRDQKFNESGEHYDPDLNISSNRVLSATLGGPILRDRLWFFAAVENQFAEETPVGAPETRVGDINLFLGKLTWAANTSNRLTLSYRATPGTVEYAGIAFYTAPEATHRVEPNEPTAQLELNSVLSDSLLLTVGLGFSREQVRARPMINDVETPPEIDWDTFIIFSNPDFVEEGDRDRDHHHAKLSYFVGDALGSHQLDAGFEYHKLQTTEFDFHARRIQSRVLQQRLLGRGSLAGRRRRRSDRPLSLPRRPARDRPRLDFESRRRLERLPPGPVAANPRAHPPPRPALRHHGPHQHGRPERSRTSRSGCPAWAWRGTSADEADTSFAPVGAATCTPGHQPVMVRARDHSRIPRSTTVSTSCAASSEFATEKWPPTALVGPEFVHVDCGWRRASVLPGQHLSELPAETVDTLGVGRLRVPYRDELILAYEARVAEATSLELSYVKKVYHDRIEDTCNNNTWAWGDGTPPSLDDSSTWTDEDACTGSVRANIDGIDRDYEALILRAASRARPWFHLVGSYTYSRTRANNRSNPYTGFGSNIGGFPGLEADYFPTNFINTYGYVNDVRHWVKLNGYLEFPLDFTLGVGAFYRSAEALSVFADCNNMFFPSDSGLAELERLGIDYDEMLGYCQSPSSGRLFLEPRGSRRTTFRSVAARSPALQRFPGRKRPPGRDRERVQRLFVRSANRVHTGPVQPSRLGHAYFLAGPPPLGARLPGGVLTQVSSRPSDAEAS